MTSMPQKEGAMILGGRQRAPQGEGNTWTTNKWQQQQRSEHEADGNWDSDAVTVALEKHQIAPPATIERKGLAIVDPENGQEVKVEPKNDGKMQRIGGGKAGKGTGRRNSRTPTIGGRPVTTIGGREMTISYTLYDPTSNDYEESPRATPSPSSPDTSATSTPTLSAPSSAAPAGALPTYPTMYSEPTRMATHLKPSQQPPTQHYTRQHPETEGSMPGARQFSVDYTASQHQHSAEYPSVQGQPPGHLGYLSSSNAGLLPPSSPMTDFMQPGPHTAPAALQMSQSHDVLDGFGVMNGHNLSSCGSGITQHAAAPLHGLHAELHPHPPQQIYPHSVPQYSQAAPASERGGHDTGSQLAAKSDKGEHNAHEGEGEVEQEIPTKMSKTQLKNQKKHQRARERKAKELREQAEEAVLSWRTSVLAAPLTNMGFPRERCYAAVCACSDGKACVDLERCVAWLLSDQLFRGKQADLDISCEISKMSECEAQGFCRADIERAVLAHGGDVDSACIALRNGTFTVSATSA